MCSSPESVYKIEVEGTVMNVCEKCSSFGRIIGGIKKEEPVKKKKKQGKALAQAEAKPKKETETIQLIVSNYSALIKRAREKLGLKQEELAKKIAEKESVIHKLESGIMKPGIPLARKLEKFLRVALVEEMEVEEVISGEKKRVSEGLTLGDLVNIR